MSNERETCLHNQFLADAKVFRLIDDTPEKKVMGYATDIKIHCAECGQPFEFIGVPSGMSPAQPMTNFDGTELRAPIRPSKQPINKDPNKVLN